MSSGPPMAVGPSTQVRYDLFILGDTVPVNFTDTLSGQLILHPSQVGSPVHHGGFHCLFVSIPFCSTYHPMRDPISVYTRVSDYSRHHK